ncbi:MAG TPA: hypothetical protein VFH34_01045 [Anaerolineales bacterium]|nr:hypothetical protein [Anaerolineales bacterium]
MQTKTMPIHSMETEQFAKFAGWSAILAGLSGFLYSISFIVLQDNLLSALFLLLGGLFSTAALTALYQRVRETESGFALLGFLLSLSAALGSAVHGGYDLANVLHPPVSPNTDLPSAIDPRGLLTFGVAGLGLFILSWLIAQDRSFPKVLVYVGYLSAFLMIVLYLGRLILLEATNLAIVIPALLEGFIVNPLWYVWLGRSLIKRP